MPVKLICGKLFFVQLFSKMTFIGYSKQYRTTVNVIKVIENVINEFDGRSEASELIQVLPDFCRFYSFL